MVRDDDIRSLRNLCPPLDPFEIEAQQLKDLTPGNEQFEGDLFVFLLVQKWYDQRVINDRCYSKNNCDVQFPDKTQYAKYQFHRPKIQNKEDSEDL